MNQRFLAVLLAGLLSATAWSAERTGTTASAVQQDLQDQHGKRRLVLDQPYSAMQTLTNHRIQENGREFRLETATKMYRDSSGRTRRDMLDSNGELVQSFITGSDGSVTMLDHRNRVVSTGGAGRHVSVRTDDRRIGAPVTAPTTGKNEGRPAVEQLGERDIEGVTATGMLVRHHIGSAAEGLDVTSETWFARELGIALYVKNTDPKGESVIAISELDRSEPDPALFAVPDGYQLQSSRLGKK